MAYNLVVIWLTGEKNIYPYYTEDMARDGEQSMKKVFGNQIAYTYVNQAY